MGIESVLNHLMVMAIYSVAGVFLMIFGFKMFDWTTPKINFIKELVEQKNVAVGMMVASIILAVAAIVVAVIVS